MVGVIGAVVIVAGVFHGAATLAAVSAVIAAIHVRVAGSRRAVARGAPGPARAPNAASSSNSAAVPHRVTRRHKVGCPFAGDAPGSPMAAGMDECGVGRR